MKKHHYFLLFIFIVFLFSCQKDDYESDISSNASIAKKAKADKDFEIPFGIAKQFEEGNFEPLIHWLNGQFNILEQQCLKSTDCTEKLVLVNQLLEIQKKLDVLGAEDIASDLSLCDGYLDETNTYVDITPGILTLGIGDNETLTAEIILGEGTCSGEIQWFSDNKDVATVDQNGYLTAIGPGAAGIVAFVSGLPNILSTLTVQVIDLPTVFTSISSEISCTTATVGGEVESDGGETVTDRGIYWGTSENPELNGTKVSVGDGLGSFSTNLTGLDPKNSTYYVKAFATNLSGIAFGYQIAFTTGMDENLIVESASHHLGDNIGNEGISFTKTFFLGDLDCYASATLSMTMNGPNSSQPPIVSLNNYVLPSVLSFLPSFSYPCWVKNEDKSYDFNCDYIYSCQVRTLLTPGINIFNIRNGRPDDDYYFSNIEIAFLSSE